MINQILNDNVKYNVLSLINILFGLAFIILLGRTFGAKVQTDSYFLSILIITYLGYFVQSFYEAMPPYYTGLKSKDLSSSSELYFCLLNQIISISLAIILFYFASTYAFDIVEGHLKPILDVFIFYLPLQNILLLNKGILNLEKHYSSYYVVDIFVNIVLLLILLIKVEQEIVYLAYATIISTALAILWQFQLIFKRINARYRLIFYCTAQKEVIKSFFSMFFL